MPRISPNISVPTHASEVNAVAWIPTWCVLVALDVFVGRVRLAGLGDGGPGEAVRSMTSLFRLTEGVARGGLDWEMGGRLASLLLRRRVIVVMGGEEWLRWVLGAVGTGGGTAGDKSKCIGTFYQMEVTGF